MNINNNNLFFYSTTQQLNKLLTTGELSWQNVQFMESFPESKYAGADYSGINFRCPDVFAWDMYNNCTYDKGQWVLFDYNHELSVRCTFDATALKECIEKVVNAKGYDLQMIPADYGYQEQVIAELHKKSSKYHKVFFEPLTNEKCLHLLSLRPSAEQIEGLFRLLLMARKKQKHAPKALKFNLDAEIIRTCVKEIEILPARNPLMNIRLGKDLFMYMMQDNLNKFSSLCPEADVKQVKAKVYKKVKL